MSGNRMDSALDERIASVLRDGIASTPEARERVMRAVRASIAPVRGAGGDDAAVGIDVRERGRTFWRSPAFGLLAAASIFGMIALVRAIGVEGPIPEVPGQQRVAARRETARAPQSVVAPAAAAGAQALGDARTRVAHVQFVFVAPQARRVAVVGDFNDWDAAATPLQSAGGVWSGQVDVPFGRHDYAFVVDGERWMRDPNAPQAPADEFGSGYSVLVVDENSGAHR